MYLLIHNFVFMFTEMQLRGMEKIKKIEKTFTFSMNAIFELVSFKKVKWQLRNQIIMDVVLIYWCLLVHVLCEEELEIISSSYNSHC